MTSPEILSKLTRKTPKYEEYTEAGSDSLGWQDILQAMQGIAPEKTSYLMFMYGDDEKKRHEVFAGLFMEAMQHPSIIEWRKARKREPGYNRDIECLCNMAIAELKHWDVKVLAKSRALFMGVSLSTWKRKYRDVYKIIHAIPQRWEHEVMQIVTQRLR